MDNFLNLLEKYWWCFLIATLVLTVFCTFRYRPFFDSYELSGKYRVEKKTAEQKVKTAMTTYSNGKTVLTMPVVSSYTEYTYGLSNGKKYQYENGKDYLGVEINEGDELYVYESAAAGWGDSDILSHKKMDVQDFSNNTSLLGNGIIIFVMIAIGMAVVWLVIYVIAMSFN